MNLKLISNLSTIVKTFINSWSMRVTQTGSFLVSSDTVVTVVGNVVNAVAHGALDIDSIVFTSGVYQYQEIKVIEIVDANNFKIGYSFPLGSEPAPGDTFRIMRPVSATYDSAGSLAVSSGPIQYTRNAAAQLVIEDTATPANNRGLPVKPIDDAGNVQKTNLNITDKVYHKIVLATPATHIPASGSATNLELVAASSSKSLKLEWQDDVGEFIGVYTGADPGTLAMVVGPGGTSKELILSAATRVSVRAMENTAISSDQTKIALHLLG